MFWETFVSINTRICQGPKKCHDHSKINVFTNKFLEKMLLKCVNAKRKCIIAIAFFFVWMKGVNSSSCFPVWPGWRRVVCCGVEWSGLEWGDSQSPDFFVWSSLSHWCVWAFLCLAACRLLLCCRRVSVYLSIWVWVSGEYPSVPASWVTRVHFFAFSADGRLTTICGQSDCVRGCYSGQRLRETLDMPVNFVCWLCANDISFRH